jgi:hypothetical protein
MTAAGHSQLGWVTQQVENPDSCFMGRDLGFSLTK